MISAVILVSMYMYIYIGCILMLEIPVQAIMSPETTIRELMSLVVKSIVVLYVAYNILH